MAFCAPCAVQPGLRLRFLFEKPIFFAFLAKKIEDIDGFWGANMKTSNRRAFLRQSASAAASLACANPLLARGAAEAVSAPVRAWVTAGEDRFKPFAVGPWRPISATSTPSVEADAGQRFQSILGFGGAFTDSSCYLFSRMDAAPRQELMQEFFGPQGLRLSVARTCIGSSDYSLTAYTYDDSPTPDPDLKNFSIAHDRDYILPTLRDALQLNPEMFLFSSPWSPPGWMKSGGSILGGAMRKKYLAAYAQYFVKFIEAYKAEGVAIRAVTSQNEVDTEQEGRMPAALWGQEYEMEFVKAFLAPSIRDASLDTKIWLLDHNYNLWGRVLDELSDPGVFQQVDGVAWHGYAGNPDAMTRVHDAFPTKHTYWTEGGPEVFARDYAIDWAAWSAKYATILKNWARCIVAWNFVLDEQGKPNIGPFNCGGIVTLDSKTKQLTRSGQYWAFAHYSKVVRRDAQVIATKSTLTGIEHVAFANPDSDYVLVLTNRGEAQEIACAFEAKAMQLSLPRNSIVTLQWS
jgi:glucosylceramidase